MSIITIMILLIIIYFIYQRYVPVCTVSKIQVEEIESRQQALILDLRDYNEVRECQIRDSYHLPFAYLKRYHQEIPCTNIFIVTSDSISKNLGIRFLRRKGFNINGFSILD